MSIWSRHKIFETNSIILILGVLIVISIGGLVEIVPLFYLKSTIEKVEGVRPYTPLEMAGRNIYVREGCYNCHSQMVRPLRDEVERYGHYSLAAESMYDRPFQWGSKRYPKAQSRTFDGNPQKVTEADALIAYLQMLGTQVDFKLYDNKANVR